MCRFCGRQPARALPIELMRSSDEEKNQQVANVEAFRNTHAMVAAPRLKHLQKVASERKNTFAALMDDRDAREQLGWQPRPFRPGPALCSPVSAPTEYD